MASLDAGACVVHTAAGDVQVARRGSGTRVLVSHGSPGGFDLGASWARHLQDGGCELIAPSRPGYLRTPLESGHSPENQADLYAAMLDTLEIERVAVYGFSGGGPSAVQFAARHPDRITVLFLEAAITLPTKLDLGLQNRLIMNSSFLVWLFYETSRRQAGLVTRLSVDGMAGGLSKEQKRAAASWITSDPARLEVIKEMAGCIAPKRYRHSGWVNDLANEANLASLPFAAVTAPTLVAHGTNDSIVPTEHATCAADGIAGAELMLVDEGHHALSISRNFGPVAQRQLDMAHTAA
jgi:pimeloyl-ACP methyl ester carboxylesterase